MKKLYIVLTLLLTIPSFTFAAVPLERDQLKGTTKTSENFNISSDIKVEIDGLLVNGIRKIKGLKLGQDNADNNQSGKVEEDNNGNDASNSSTPPPHTRPGNQKPGQVNITPIALTIIKDFAPNDKTFFNWYKSVIDGRTQRKSVSIIFMNDNDVESTRINLYDCYPTAWKGPNFDSINAGHATEKIDIVCGRVEFK